MGKTRRCERKQEQLEITSEQSIEYNKMLREWCFLLENLDSSKSNPYLAEIEKLLGDVEDLRSPWREQHFVRGALKVGRLFGQV